MGRPTVRAFRAEDGSLHLSVLWSDGRFLLSVGPRLQDSGWSLVRRGQRPQWGGLWTWTCLAKPDPQFQTSSPPGTPISIGISRSGAMSDCAPTSTMRQEATPSGHSSTQSSPPEGG